MADDNTSKRVGISIGTVGGSMHMTAGGDIVGGDKTVSITNLKGFAAEEQKQQFQALVDQLREALKSVKLDIEAHPSLDADQKEDATAEIVHTAMALKRVKEKTANVPAGTQAPADVASTVESTLEQASGVIDKLQEMAKKALGVTETIGQFAGKYGPMIVSARHLFGLP